MDGNEEHEAYPTQTLDTDDDSEQSDIHENVPSRTSSGHSWDTESNSEPAISDSDSEFDGHNPYPLIPAAFICVLSQVSLINKSPQFGGADIPRLTPSFCRE
jgi:hypothetical protein